MQRKYYGYCLLAMLALSGCRANQLLAEYQKLETSKLAITGQVGKITIQDVRSDTTSESLKLPVFSLPGQQARWSPTLTQEHEMILTEQIRSNFTGEGPMVDITVILEQAYQEFSASWASEKEYGYASVTIELYDPDSHQKQVWCSSSGDFFIQSVDATRKRMEEVYRVALKRVVNVCLSQIKETLATP